MTKANSQHMGIENTEKRITELLETKNPLKFLRKTVNLTSEINRFFNYGIEKISEAIQGDYQELNSNFYKILYNSGYQEYIYHHLENYIKDSKYFHDEIRFEIYWKLQDTKFRQFFEKTASKLKEKGNEPHLTSKEISALKKEYPEYQDFISEFLENTELFTPRYNKKGNLDYISFLHQFYIEFGCENFINQLEKNFGELEYEKLRENKNFSLMIRILGNITANYTENISPEIYEKFREEINNYINGKKENLSALMNKKTDQKDSENNQMRSTIRSILIRNCYPEILKAMHYFSKEFVNSKRSFETYRLHIEKLGEIEKFRPIKDFILQFRRTILSSITEPFLLAKLAKEIGLDIKSDERNLSQRHKIKTTIIFGLTEDYKEYQTLYDFLTKLEAFMKDSKILKFKLITGYSVTTLIILTISFFFLPFGLTLLLIIGFLRLVKKIFKELKEHTEYKIKFNFGINILVTISIPVLLGTSVMVTESDAYKSGYKKFKEIINVLSANTLADILEYTEDKKADINSSGTGKTNAQTNCKITRNYINTQNSCYEREEEQKYQENESKQQENSAPEKTKDSEKKQDKELLFKDQTLTLGNGVMLRNAVEKVINRHAAEGRIQIEKSSQGKFIRKISEIYIKSNIEKFRKRSINRNSSKMYRNELAKRTPEGFRIKLEEIEKILLSISE